MAIAPQYASTPVVTAGILTTGDASLTAPAVSVPIFAPAGGVAGMCERITIAKLATTTSSVIRIFRHNGTTFYLYAEIQIPALTLAANTANPNVTLQAVDYPDLFPIAVPATWTLKATISTTQTGIAIQGEGGAF
ncbi:MAG: hypothetical protein V4621_07470 [Pseudomonadota bacterium]